jgi:hypothetical protein
MLILQLDTQGQPIKWISWQDAITLHAKGLVTWSLGESNTTARGGQNRMTGMQSIIHTSSIIAVKGSAKGKKRFSIPSLSNKELFRRDHNICAYCAKHFPDSKLTRDHIVPTSRGGKDTWMNVVSACERCNNHKNDSLLSECSMKLVYVPYVPSSAEFLLLQNRQVLSDQMEFLMSFIPETSRAHQYLKH